MAYSDLLKDPRWQKKRLTIFNRDNFTCVSCGADDRTLHVHHHIYLNGKMPWEYNDIMLVTLCDRCHEKEEALKSDDENIVKMLLCGGLLRTDIQKLVNVLCDKGGGSKPSHFRTIFNRALDRFRYRPKKLKSTIKLTDFLKVQGNG